MKIGIICGGRSSEHEVSILTAIEVYKKCPWIKYFYYINHKGVLKRIIKPKPNRMLGYRVLFRKGRIGFNKLDCIIVAMHGQNGEDGMISALLEYYEIAYVGTDMEGSILSFDKDINYKLLFNIVPMIEKKVINFSQAESPLEYPVIVKPARAGSSLGISVARNNEEYLKAILNAKVYDSKIIVEKLLEGFEEVSIAAYKDIFVKTSEVELIRKKNTVFTFDEKYYNHHKNEQHIYMGDCEITRLIKKYTILIYEALELKGIVRMDYMIKDNQVYFNEVNNIPGALANYYFNDFNKILMRLVEKSREQHITTYPKLAIGKMIMKK